MYDVYRTVPNLFTTPYLINRNRNVTVLYLSRHSISLGTLNSDTMLITIRTYWGTYLFYGTFLYYKYKPWNRWNSNYCDCILEDSNSKSINCRGCYLSTHYDFYSRESNRRNSSNFILVVATTNKIFTLVDLLCWWFW